VRAFGGLARTCQQRAHTGGVGLVDLARTAEAFGEVLYAELASIARDSTQPSAHIFTLPERGGRLRLDALRGRVAKGEDETASEAASEGDTVREIIRWRSNSGETCRT
jgi:hypothetical protein